MDNKINTKKRYVAYLDILGFKDLTYGRTHQYVLNRLRFFNEQIPLMLKEMAYKEVKIEDLPLKVVTFSDTILIFTEGEQPKDLQNLVITSYVVFTLAFICGFPIKGVFSHGTVTVDLENSIYFGKPIIDAYLLHDQLQMYAMIFDHHTEKKFRSSRFETDQIFKFLINRKVHLKSGLVRHWIVRPPDDKAEHKYFEFVIDQYAKVSGSTRKYVDNTLEFLESLDELDDETNLRQN